MPRPRKTAEQIAADDSKPAKLVVTLEGLLREPIEAAANVLSTSVSGWANLKLAELLGIPLPVKAVRVKSAKTPAFAILAGVTDKKQLAAGSKAGRQALIAAAVAAMQARLAAGDAEAIAIFAQAEAAAEKAATSTLPATEAPAETDEVEVPVAA